MASIRLFHFATKFIKITKLMIFFSNVGNYRFGICILYLENYLQINNKE